MVCAGFEAQYGSIWFNTVASKRRTLAAVPQERASEAAKGAMKAAEAEAQP